MSHPKTELISRFLGQFMIGFGIFGACVSVLSQHFSPTNEVFMEMVKSFDASTYVAIAMVMIGYIKIRHSKSHSLALAALFCLLMAFSSQLVSLLPTDIVFEPDNFTRQTVIYGPISLMFVSLYGITFNLAVMVFKSVEGEAASH
ncbi:hypothetical protein JNO04_05270 [Halomonas sp. MC140]|nr:hypothetical protein [Halomonas sp. MC140]MDN7131765.1 hypothetical protein [Halomonas sp. MC140]